MKILFTSVGRRVELMQAFHNAANKIGVNLEIIGADASTTAPALSFCDNTVHVPRIDNPQYISFLQNYCRDNNVNALIPTIDTDLLILAQNKNAFGSTKVIISDPDKVAICRDKRLTGAFFGSCGLRFPEPVDDYKEYDQGFPAFIKPKDGSSSINAYKVENEEELLTFSEIVPDYIIQPYISGTEYTVDAFCDFDGNPIFITPRIRLAVRAGEVLKTKIDQDETIIAEMQKLIEKYRPCGAITVQLIRDDRTKKDYFIEINPRFGGGAPLSIKAGADSAEMMMRLLAGEKVNYQDKAAENGAVFSRFDQSVRVDR
jgi:carbamoylphosphate synthase large subunit